MDFQLSILEFFQTLRSPILSTIFLIFTISTELPILVLFTATIYWCINKKYGQRMLFALIANITVNTGIKEFFRAPRPIGVKGLDSMRISTATGYSFPSGHTQSATTFWVSMIMIFKEKWIYILGSIMILGVGVSRLYLAVHWPIDVLFGWIFGIIFTILFLNLFNIVDKNKNYSLLIVMLIIFIVIAFLLNSVEYTKILGLLTGFILGYIVEDKYIQFETNISKTKIRFSNKRNNRNRMIINLYRLIVGIFTLALVYIGLKYIMPSGYIYDYIRYSIAVFYGIAGVPAIFKLLKLN